MVNTPAIWVMSSELGEIPSKPAVTCGSVGIGKVSTSAQVAAGAVEVHASAVVSDWV
jgi:hypothetical protein